MYQATLVGAVLSARCKAHAPIDFQTDHVRSSRFSMAVCMLRVIPRSMTYFLHVMEPAEGCQFGICSYTSMELAAVNCTQLVLIIATVCMAYSAPSVLPFSALIFIFF